MFVCGNPTTEDSIRLFFGKTPVQNKLNGRNPKRRDCKRFFGVFFEGNPQYRASKRVRCYVLMCEHQWQRIFKSSLVWSSRRSTNTEHSKGFFDLFLRENPRTEHPEGFFLSICGKPTTKDPKNVLLVWSSKRNPNTGHPKGFFDLLWRGKPTTEHPGVLLVLSLWELNNRGSSKFLLCNLLD